MGVTKTLKAFGFAAALLCAGTSYAQSSGSKAVASTPHQSIEQITQQMMSIIEDGEQELKEQPEKYYAEIRQVLEPTVSFGYIAKNVMAGYWNSASEEQRQRFTEAFTLGMVETLGKGMANYSNLDIKTLPPEGDVKGEKRIEVLQEIRGADGVNRVSYTMANHPTEGWKLINVVLNGVNLGKSFRDQFAQAMRQHDNNIDKVIAEWATQE